MGPFTEIKNWLEVWSLELAIMKWSLESDSDDHHTIFTLAGAVQIQPLLSFEEVYQEIILQMLEGKNSSLNATELMEITMRVLSRVDFDKLAKEAQTLCEMLHGDFGKLGDMTIKDKTPLYIFCFLHRVFAVEVSARIKTYEPGKHNPLLGPFQPMLEELLSSGQAPVKGE
ncbi:hypothetical protein FDJ25_gp002 [Vibrio phage Aphrodite1]|uniref:Uncharacterized protein n=1 Tax=Vibrio phage Aphrodite1 TaxID=2070057 RepID=A0A2I7QI14_9CAUD|nr:hypothetical protein FDJ25_gp002 [Vibrio phage Aphrodite1]AUR81040.1 hypothetical protein Aphrodite1_0208 [Vibrio phage Aphrodite1]